MGMVRLIGSDVNLNPATLSQPYVAVPYVSILSATPAGNYTFSVSAGQLPPGLQPVTALGVSSIVGLPTTPGTYSFTILAKKSCTGLRRRRVRPDRNNRCRRPVCSDGAREIPL